ncbi:MAG: response regulator [Bacteroidota bacterium]
MKSHSRKKILVIDDSETNLVLLKAVLEDAGYEVQLAGSSKDAFFYFENDRPDLILLDLLMPQEDGFMFMEKLKNGYVQMEVPVIVVTAYANRENEQRAKTLGAQDVIEKPIDIPEFLMKIDKAVSN